MPAAEISEATGKPVGADLRAEVSTAETQFGHLHRPVHTNTSWEAAKFEICAHRFLHVGEPGYGVAVVNDSTYGHEVTRTTRDDGGTTTTVRLSLPAPEPEGQPGGESRSSAAASVSSSEKRNSTTS